MSSRANRYRMMTSGADTVIAAVQTAVATHFNVPVETLTMRTRGVHKGPVWHARARHVAMYLSRQMTGASLPAIGYRFGRRDHTTVLYGLRSVAARMREDRETAAEIAGIKDTVIIAYGVRDRIAVALVLGVLAEACAATFTRLRVAPCEHQVRELAIEPEDLRVLSAKHRRLFDFCVAEHDAGRSFPSRAAILAHMGRRSREAAGKNLKALAEMGFLTQRRHGMHFVYGL